MQSCLNPDETGVLFVERAFRCGLDGLRDFDFIWLLTWLQPEDGPPPALRQVPYLRRGRGEPIGVFAMRGPRRPSPIGLSLVRVLEVTEEGCSFAGVDMLDGTPVIDIKPFVAAFDVPPDRTLDAPVRNGWFDGVDLLAPHTPSSLRQQTS